MLGLTEFMPGRVDDAFLGFPREGVFRVVGPFLEARHDISRNKVEYFRLINREVGEHYRKVLGRVEWNCGCRCHGGSGRRAFWNLDPKMVAEGEGSMPRSRGGTGDIHDRLAIGGIMVA
jgi:hypothetical protein